jgi:PAS domain S-box-containing protein
MKSLKQRERDLLRAQQVGHVGSYVAYPASGRVELSDELCAILGCAPGEISHDLGISFVHPEDRKRVHATRQQARTGAVPPEVEYRVLRRDGSIRQVYERWEIQRDSRGEPVKILGTVADITVHKQSEAALAEALAEVTHLKERFEAENVYLRGEVRLAHGFDEIVGESPELMECLRLVQRVAPTDSTVLILGETGVGKELIARAIHAWSPRGEGPLVSVNCAALPETLIESELFGHERGAFTGALARRLGRFELASGGTLFLDEIGDLPLHLQGKLLRVLQESEIERVGGSEVIPVDVRVIGSTHRDLERAVETGAFRADLYFRISGFPIRVPPLRERASDIPLLVDHFAHKHAKRLGREIDSISTRMLQHLMAYSWPGNVRELENLVRRILISSSGPVLDLAEPLRPLETPQALALGAKPSSLREVERNHILRVLEQAHWVIEGNRGASALLGIRPSTLRSRMKKLGIARRA